MAIIDPRDNPGDALSRSVKAALDEEIRRIVEEEVQNASLRVKEKVRDAGG